MCVARVKVCVGAQYENKCSFRWVFPSCIAFSFLLDAARKAATPAETAVKRGVVGFQNRRRQRVVPIIQYTRHWWAQTPAVLQRNAQCLTQPHIDADTRTGPRHAGAGGSSHSVQVRDSAGREIILNHVVHLASRQRQP